MKKYILVTLLLATISSFGQATKFAFDLEEIKNNENLPQREALWLYNNLASNEIKEAVDLVSALSQPAAAQMLVSYFYLDGSFSRRSLKPYMDSLKVRPPDGDAGIIRVTYLVSKVREIIIKNGKANKVYTARFTEEILEIPEVNRKHLNNKIELSFDYQPVQILHDILSEPNISYSKILSKLNLPQFDELIQHRSQSFYYTPTNIERLATCLEIAASTKPLDELYKYMNPAGLLNFTDVKTNLSQYKEQLNVISDNERAIFNYINASIAQYLPPDTKFSREISFFYINGADGWATDNVIAVDLNYFKNDYKKLLGLMIHETYHGGQNAVSLTDSIEHEENVEWFIVGMDYLFAEGTATYVAPPQEKTKEDKEVAIRRGVQLVEEIYNNTQSDFDVDKIITFINEGVASSGPFYWLGEEISRIIVDELGKEKLASIIPYGGISFIKAYLEAVNKSKLHENMFSSSFTNYIQMIN